MMAVPQGANTATFLESIRQYVPDAFLWSWAGYNYEQKTTGLADFQLTPSAVQSESEGLPTLGSEGEDVSDKSLSIMVAGESIIAGQALSDGKPSNYTDSVVSRAKNYANQQLENSVADWLSPYGTIEFSTDLLNNLNAPSASLNALVPLYDSESQLWFTQLGYQINGDSTFSGRDFLNIGLGTRYSTDEYLVGVNTFFDRDMTRSHLRASAGAEIFADYLKLIGNYYFPLSDWKNSPDFDNYEERAARGFDVDVTGYLPSYSHLGASLTYEQYFGDEIDILGTKNKQSNPYVGSLTLDYTPVSLISFNTGITKAKGSNTSLNAGIDITYRFNAPWEKQVSPDYVDVTRQLDGQRYDLVKRNNNIVLEYRDKGAFTATLSDQSALALNAGDNYQPFVLNVTINGEEGVIPQARAQARAQAREESLRSVAVDSDYQVEWTLPPAFMAPSSLSDLQAFEILIPITPDIYEYTVTVTQKNSGESQTLTKTLTVESDPSLHSIYFLPTDTINTSQNSSRFDVIQVADSPELSSAFDRYVAHAGATLTPTLMQHTDMLDIVWDDPKVTLTTKDGSPLNSVITLTDEPLISMVYLFTFDELIYPIDINESNIDSDGDGTPNKADVDPNNPNSDSDGDGISDLDETNNGSDPLDPNDPIAPLNIGADTTLTVGGTHTGTVSDGNNGSITYTSSDPLIASVDLNGLITANNIGSVTITGDQAMNGILPAQTATYTVTVNPASPGDAAYTALSAGSDVTKRFGEANFTQVATGGNGGAITYSSATPAVATVDSNTGEVTIVGVGSVVITATEAASTNFAGQTATYTVTVNPASSGDAAYTALAAGSDVTKAFGEANFTQAATGGNGGAITYSSATPAVATVDSNTGEVTVVGAGSVVITATEAASTNFAGQTATYTVTVNPASPGDAVYTALDIGSDVTKIQSDDFTRAATGGNGGAITYSSATTTVATVDNTGKVTIVRAGSTVITATEAASANFVGQTASYTLNVEKILYSDGQYFTSYVDKRYTHSQAVNQCQSNGHELASKSEVEQLFVDEGYVKEWYKGYGHWTSTPDGTNYYVVSMSGNATVSRDPSSLHNVICVIDYQP